MLQVKVSDIARQTLNDIVDYYLEHFGYQPADRLITEFEKKLHYIATYPETGFPEPLAFGMVPFYRAVHISRYLKLIYYVEDEDHAVMVADVWDTRMHPDKLKQRLTEQQA